MARVRETYARCASIVMAACALAPAGAAPAPPQAHTAIVVLRPAAPVAQSGAAQRAAAAATLTPGRRLSYLAAALGRETTTVHTSTVIELVPWVLRKSDAAVSLYGPAFYDNQQFQARVQFDPLKAKHPSLYTTVHATGAQAFLFDVHTLANPTVPRANVTFTVATSPPPYTAHNRSSVMQTITMPSLNSGEIVFALAAPRAGTYGVYVSSDDAVWTWYKTEITPGS